MHDACSWLGDLAAHHVQNGPDPDTLPERDFSANSWQCRSCPFLAVCLPGAAQDNGTGEDTEIEEVSRRGTGRGGGLFEGPGVHQGT